jgi:hypothetical protein
MADKKNNSRGENLAKNADDGLIATRVQELTWALLDEQINDDEFKLLDNLLLSDEKARHTYLECTQLHAELTDHFAVSTGATGSRAAKESPLLGFLGDSSLGLQSQSGEQTVQ